MTRSSRYHTLVRSHSNDAAIVRGGGAVDAHCGCVSISADTSRLALLSVSLAANSARAWQLALVYACCGALRRLQARGTHASK